MTNTSWRARRLRTHILSRPSRATPRRRPASCRCTRRPGWWEQCSCCSRCHKCSRPRSPSCFQTRRNHRISCTSCRSTRILRSHILFRPNRATPRRRPASCRGTNYSLLAHPSYSLFPQPCSHHRLPFPPAPPSYSHFQCLVQPSYSRFPFPPAHPSCSHHRFPFPPAPPSYSHC
jgi:hypothetical protein